MALTRKFKQLVQARAVKDRAFREGLFAEAISAFTEGDLDTAKALLRDYINATVGFQRLAAVTKINDKSLMRMFGPRGNPQAGNLGQVIAHLKKETKVRIQVHAGS